MDLRRKTQARGLVTCLRGFRVQSWKVEPPWNGLSSGLFSAHISMRQLMHSPDMLQLARWVVECLKLFEASQQ